MNVSEREWTENYLVPLLRRLGYRKIDFTHGVLEAGRDVVFADIDRFGLLKYYAAQIKMGSLRSESETQELRTIIAQVSSAYETPYRDPSTGTEHKISGVYLIVNGAVTEAARQVLFGKTGQWLYVVDKSQCDIARFVTARFSDEDRRVRISRVGLDFQEQAKILRETKESLRLHTSGRIATLQSLPMLVPTRSIERLLDVALSELHFMDVVLIEQVLRYVNAINLIVLKLPVGKVDPHAVGATVDAYKVALDELLRLIPFLTELLEYYLEVEPPVPGTRLPRCPDTVGYEAVYRES